MFVSKHNKKNPNFCNVFYSQKQKKEICQNQKYN